MTNLRFRKSFFSFAKIFLDFTFVCESFSCDEFSFLKVFLDFTFVWCYSNPAIGIHTMSLNFISGEVSLASLASSFFAYPMPAGMGADGIRWDRA